MTESLPLLPMFHPLQSDDPGDADLDGDGDGLTNRDEYRAGTDPGDSNDVLRVEGIRRDGGLWIDFYAVSNRTYGVEYLAVSEGTNWKVLERVPARGQTGMEAVEDPTTAPMRFYRLITPAGE